MIRRLLFAVLFFATTASARITFDPPIAISDRPTTLRIDTDWNYSCPPDAVRTRIDVGNVRVTIVAPDRIPCSVFSPVATRITVTTELPPLHAGMWNVDVNVESAAGNVRREGPVALTVRDADAPFVVEPEVLLQGTGVMREFVLRWRTPQGFCVSGPGCGVPTVLIGLWPVGDFDPNDPSKLRGQVDVVDASTLRVALEKLPIDGVFPVTVVRGETRHEADSAITIVKEPGPGLLERILVPLVFHGPGAHGSLWTTDVWIRNENLYGVLSEDRLFSFCHPLASPCIPQPIETGQTVHWDASQGMRAPEGVQLFVPRGSADGLHITALIRDLSRQEEAIGAELPIARERDFKEGPFSIVRVPVASGFRTALRVYGTWGGTITLRFVKENGDMLRKVSMNLRGSGQANIPPTAILNDLVQQYPELAGAGLIRIEISGSEPLWAFASVTNNTTQHVTNIRPQ